MVEILNLSKSYNKKKAINIIELTIDTGNICGFVGNNGAGKTTLFRLILDLIKADNGTVLSNEWNVAKSEKWKDYTGSYLDEGFLMDFLTPEEFFYFIGNLYNFSNSIIDEKLSKFKYFLNGEILGQKRKFIRDFSKGHKQKIGIVSALLIDPRVLILDEPFNSLDPTSQIVLKRMLIDYNTKARATILISSHDLNHVTEICHQIVLLENGHVIRNIQNNDKALKELNEYFSLEKLFTSEINIQ